jgi:hypothetical protein
VRISIVSRTRARSQSVSLELPVGLLESYQLLVTHQIKAVPFQGLSADFVSSDRGSRQFQTKPIQIREQDVVAC